MKKLYLVDVSNMFFRAYYAIPPLNTAEGLPTNALYGFLTMTLKLLKEIKPDYIAYCFDRKEPSFRADLYEEYKANRGEMPEDLVPQVPYIRELTDLLGIPQLDKKGFEADDIIGTLAHAGEKEGVEVVIVSGDKDFAQLVGPHTFMYDTMKNIKYDEQGVIEKWGIKPEQVIDYLSIVGDTSDNIPGVRGIGPKGAQKLLAEFKTLDGIYKNLDKIKGKSMKAKLEEHKKDAYLAKELVSVVTDVDLDLGVKDLKLKPINKQALEALLKKLEFDSFIKKLLNNNSNSTSVGATASMPKSSKASSKKTKAAGAMDSSSTLTRETWNLEKLHKKLQPYSEVWVVLNERGFCLGYDNKAIQVEAEMAAIGEVLEEKLISWKGYDIKHLWKALSLKEPQQPAVDQMLSAYVLRAGNISSFEEVYQKYTGKALPELAGPEEILEASLELEDLLNPKLDEQGGHQILEEMELPLVPVLYQMERQGIYLDQNELAKQSKLLEKDIAELEKKVFKESGESFNVASTKQLAEVLFKKMGIPPSKKTKTGYSTNSDVLSKLAQDYPICAYVLEFRELSKLKSTYVDALPRLVSAEDGKIHTQFRQAVTTTGRLSSVNPNLQNIPIRTERGRLIRKAFTAPKGHLILSIDYSQIELRILAEITEDPGLCGAFEKEKDVHVATASEIFGVPYDEVDSEQRRMAKAVNFGIAYGQGAFGLSESLGISRQEAADIIESYFSRFKKVKSYMEDIVNLAKRQGYVETLFGRRRYIDELKSKNGNIQKFGERAAINAPIQGTASDIVKKAMVAVANEVSIPMLLQVHDELLFECPESEVEDQAQDIKEIMESVVELKIPLKVNVAWGQNWEDAHA